MHEQTQIVASVACRVGSQEFHSWIASLPLVSLLFIVISIYFPFKFLLILLLKSNNPNTDYTYLPTYHMHA